MMAHNSDNGSEKISSGGTCRWLSCLTPVVMRAGGGALDALLEYSTGSVKIQTEEVPYIVRYCVVASLGQAICVILLLDRRLSLR